MTVTVATPLYGRDAELGIVGDALDAARRGRGAVVLVEGAPGMGKTRLLEESIRIARRLAIRYGYGDADPAEAMVELAPLLRALFEGPEPILRRDALPALRGGAEQRYWLLQDLQALLERAAAAGPLLLCVDDLQWADAGTAAALRRLPAALQSLPIVWLLASRPALAGAVWAAVAAPLIERGAGRIVLEPLTEETIVELASGTLAATPDAGLVELAASAAGNPFLLVELLLGLREERMIRVEDGTAHLLEARLPSRVDAGMRNRLGRLSESARQAALTAASLGRRFTMAELAAMLGSSPAALLTAVEQLVDAGVFSDGDEGLGFRHDLIRDAVRAGISAPARRALDRQAVDVLLAAGAVPAEVAMQLAASAEPGDESAVALLAEVAEALGPRAPAAAAKLSSRALELIPTGHPWGGRLVATTTVMLHAAGEADAAQRFGQEWLREVLPPAEEAAVCLSLAEMFALSPDLRAQAGRRALSLPGLSAGARAQHHARLVYNLVQAGRRSEARELLEQSRSSVAAAGDLADRSILMLAEAVLAYMDGEFERALALHEQAMRDGFGPGEQTRVWVARQWRAELLAVQDRYDDALALLSAGVADAQRERQAFALEFLDIWRGRALLQIGELADAAAVLGGRFDAAAGAPATSALYAAAVVALGRIAIHTGDERRRREVNGIAQAMLATGTPANRGHASWMLALLAMAAGEIPDLLALEILPLYPLDVTDEPQLVRIALVAGDRELAQRAAELARRRARLNPAVATVQALAEHARGLLEADACVLTQACELFARSPRRLAHASALEDLGVAQLRSGAQPAGLETLGRTLELYSELGASWDAARVRGRLRVAGVRRRLGGKVSPRFGLEALTESERSVAALVSEGMTNREVAERLFLSPHTVNTHLRHAFAKLGVNSRLELAQALTREPDR